MKTFPLIDLFPRAFKRSLRVPLKKKKKIKLPPLELREEIEAAALVAAERVVKKKFIGAPADVDDIIGVVAFASLPRVYKWRPGGTKSLQQYAYGSCNWAFVDLMRERQATPSQDALDHLDPMPWQMNKGPRDELQDDTLDMLPAERLTDEMCERDEPEFNDEATDE